MGLGGEGWKRAAVVSGSSSEIPQRGGLPAMERRHHQAGRFHPSQPHLPNLPPCCPLTQETPECVCKGEVALGLWEH